MALKNKNWCAHIMTVLLVTVMSVAFSGCEEPDEDTVSNAGASNTSPAASGNRQSLQRLSGETPYSVDSVNSKPLPKGTVTAVDSGTTPNIIVSGWAIDGKAQSVAGGVLVAIDAATEMPATYGAERPDVAEVLKNPNYKMSGFGVAIPTATVGKGRHTLSLKILSADKKGYYEPAQKIELDVR